MKNRKKLVGWISFAMAIGLFCLQMVYFYLHAKFFVEYSDNRLFYVFNIAIAILLGLSTIVLFNIKKMGKFISLSILLLFILINATLLFKHPILQIVSVSPDYKNIFVVKEIKGEARYYRTYYGIFARQKETLPYQLKGEYKIDWLTNDVAAMTYRAMDNSLHQYIGTYGDRGSGISYYYVGSALHGDWRGNDSSISVHTEGITVEHGGSKETFNWDQIVQFGTLAVVLVDDYEAKWTISLNDDFKMDSSSGIGVAGTISLFQASLEDKEILVLKR
ncbi:hypothetical protein [Fredinandcohnia onubensis]|uniref:hypothetical protein n=1 Tax=Fredinandcohnia onubensis TaxID=1571209 RepID=UPI000C0BFEBB|nr:hypothetical protein [Fredinandcohnia onubensis]